jgi:outer membrane protein assembly factor BamE (lipoprotein component of BamABCDE complex)
MQIILYSGPQLSILMCCLVAGCYLPMPDSLPPNAARMGKVDQSIVQQLQTGKSTRVDVLLLLGAPSRRVEDDRFFIYKWSATTGMVAIFPGQTQGDVVNDFAYCLEFTNEGILKRQQLIGGRLNMFKGTTKQQVEEWTNMFITKQQIEEWTYEYAYTIKVFKEAGASGVFFDKSYGYAVFPTISKGGLWIGGAYGNGRVYERGKYVGDTSMTQVSIGLQLGGQAYRQIVFFEDKRAFDNFTSGNFEFGAEASAVALTAGASAQATTTGSSAGAGSNQHDATTKGSKFNNGMAIFTVAKGGLMYEASIGGQKFSYTPK